MNRALAGACLCMALLGGFAPSSEAAWARFQIADFHRTARRPKIVRLNDGPALIALESDGLHVLRRSTEGWQLTTLRLDPKRQPHDFEVCDCRGDGVIRLYLTYTALPRVWEITPYGQRWAVNEFSPHRDRPSPHSNNLGAIGCGISGNDKRPHLFISDRARSQLHECRWTGDWLCAKILKDSAISFPLQILANPPDWQTSDLIFVGGALLARDPEGWHVVRNNMATRLFFSRTKPRTFYMYGLKNAEMTLDRELQVVRERALPANEPSAQVDSTTTGLPFQPGTRLFRQGQSMSGDTVAVLPSEPKERIYGANGGRVYEFREEGEAWSPAIVADFAGTQAYEVRAGDLRGDGMDRLYVLETAMPFITPSRLWELVYYPSSDVVEVLDPSATALAPEGSKLLGDIMRAELVRHGGLSMSHAGGLAAAADERALNASSCGRPDCPKTSVENIRPDYRILSTIEARGEAFILNARLIRLDDGKALKELTGAAVSRGELPGAVLKLALKISEDWPLWTRRP